MMTLDEQLLGEAKTVRERLLDRQHEVELARVDYQHVIRRLHAAGGSMREIAEELGLSHQRVHQIVDAGPEDARERGGRFGRGGNRRFARLTRYARAAVEQARAESMALGHGYIGTEHLLLGLLRTEGGGAAAALESLGVGYDAIRAEVERAAGTARHRGRGAAPMTPKAKKALELAVHAAGARSARWVGTEDLLVGLAEVDDGLAAELLKAAGADEARIRAAVAQVLGR